MCNETIFVIYICVIDTQIITNKFDDAGYHDACYVTDWLSKSMYVLYESQYQSCMNSEYLLKLGHTTDTSHKCEDSFGICITKKEKSGWP